jgi:hypothetical protein
MLDRILTLAKIPFFLALTVMCIEGGVFAFQARSAARKKSAAIDTLVAGLNTTLAQVNNPRGGTLQLVNKDLVDVKSLIVHIDQTAFAAQQASQAQIASINAWDGKVSVALDSANGVLLSLQRTSDGLGVSQAAIAGQAVATLQETQATIAGLKPVSDNAAAEIAELQKTTADLDAIMPALNLTAQNSASTMGHINGTAADVQQAVHDYLHPTLLHRIYSALANTGVEVAKFFF